MNGDGKLAYTCRLGKTHQLGSATHDHKASELERAARMADLVMEQGSKV